MGLLAAAAVSMARAGFQEPPETTGAGEEEDEDGACAGCWSALAPVELLAAPRELDSLPAPDDCLTAELVPAALWP